MRPEYALQLTIPALEPSATTLASYQRYHNFPETPYAAIYESVTKLGKLRPWHSIEFGEQPLHDFFGAQAIETAIRVINADSGHAGGVRVRFRRGATYSNLVKVLDIMQITGQWKYWLDIRHQPLTFYAITDRKLPARPTIEAEFICSNCSSLSDQYPPIPLTWQQRLALYWQPAWQLPLGLAIAIGCLSGYQLTLKAKSRSAT